jgi:hypothetical protein
MRWLGFGVRRSAGVDRCRSACARPPFLFLSSALPYSTRLVIKSQRGWCVRNGWLEIKAHVQIQQRQHQHRIAIVVHASIRTFWAGQQSFVVASFPKIAKTNVGHGTPCQHCSEAMQLHKIAQAVLGLLSCSGEGPKAGSICVRACARQKVPTAGRMAVNVLRCWAEEGRSWERKVQVLTRKLRDDTECEKTPRPGFCMRSLFGNLERTVEADAIKVTVMNVFMFVEYQLFFNL